MVEGTLTLIEKHIPVRRHYDNFIDGKCMAPGTPEDAPRRPSAPASSNTSEPAEP